MMAISPELRSVCDEAFVKHDQRKPRMSLLPPEALREIAKVLDYGAKKYSTWNWRKGCEWMRYTDAAMRHITDWLDAHQSDEDPETGISHLAHAGCCIMFLIAMEERGLGTDDRHKLPEMDNA